MLERSVPESGWSVPTEIELNSSSLLIWNERAVRRRITDSHGVLSGFVRLVDAEPEQVLRYARKWGVLGICRHGLPASHNPPVAEVGRMTRKVRCIADGNEAEGVHWEPLNVWRRFAGQFRALLDASAAAIIGETVPRATWERALGRTTVGPGTERVRVIPDQISIARALEQLMAVADVRPRVHWNGGESLAISIGGVEDAERGALFGALTTQLVFTIARSDGLAICSACGQAYAPQRRPKTGQRNYCPACREDGVPGRVAQRMRTERLRAATRMAQ